MSRIVHMVLAIVAFSFATVSEARVFRGSFEDAGVHSDAEAARFLTQATFGPTPEQIAQVRGQGAPAWITQQLAMPATLARPYLEAKAAEGLGVGPGHRIDRWMHTAVAAPDQLRQRVAFALSQVFVVSDIADNLVNDWRGIAEYQDLMAVHAFGSFRDLLEAVALSPQMGKYLSHWRNRKATASSQPDENFAREVMQLFSIGLVWLNPDHSPMLDAAGKPIPTYDQAVVTEMAQVFTGFGHRCPDPPGMCDPYDSLGWVFDGVAPMVCFPLYHDGSEKQLLDLDPGPGEARALIPAGPVCDPAPSPGSPQEAACFAHCAADLDATLDLLASHPNVAPFLSRQLIQRLVTSNPSPAYIARVATVFDATDGNLGATVRAILLDPEAIAFDPQIENDGLPPTFGKLREPLLRRTAVWRAFGAVPGTCAGSCLDQSGAPASLSELRMGERNPERAYAQRPFGAPSVFNFYSPVYQPPGPLADAALYAPELQIINESTVATVGNDLWGIVWAGYDSGTGSFAAPTRTAHLPPAVIDALPQEPAALIAELDRRLLYGTMSGTLVPGQCAAGTGMKGALYRLLACDMASAEHRRKVLGAVHLVALSPEFAIQR